MENTTFEFLDAAAFGSFERMVDILDSGMDVNSALPTGETALITAAGGGDVCKVRYLLDHGADISRRTREGADALMTAVAQGNVAVVELLLSRGADWSRRLMVFRGLTPLCMASQSGNIGCVMALVSAGADVNQRAEDGSCPLMNAIYKGHMAIVRFLLKNGADGRRMINGSSLKDLARQWGHDEICDVLDETTRQESAGLHGTCPSDHEGLPDFKALASDMPSRPERNVRNLGPIRFVLWCLLQIVHLVFIVVMLPIGFIVGIVSGAGRTRR